MGLKYCKLNEKEQRKLLKYYVSEVTARSAADRMGIQANTAALFYRKVRQIITERLEADASEFNKKTQRLHTSHTVPAFSMLKQGEKVYTQILDRIKTDTMLPTSVTRHKKWPANMMDMNNDYSHQKLGVSAFKPYTTNHAEFLVNKQHPVYGVNNFWNQTERTLRRYNGIPAKQFHLFLKECEFRFNYGSQRKQLSTLKKWCNL